MWWFLLIIISCKLSLIFSQSLPLLLLVSFDGFRFDYPKIYGPLENFSRLKQRGVHVHSMISTFNTATLPNQYTYADLIVFL
jgi:predicted AlkP superfamily pyrophosphatase or phosphodiesterase